jgi:hypothetical protein
MSPGSEDSFKKRAPMAARKARATRTELNAQPCPGRYGRSGQRRENLRVSGCKAGVLFLLPLLSCAVIIEEIGTGIPVVLSSPVQRAGRATILPPNSNPSSGRLGAYYFETSNRSQVWIDLEPQLLEPGPHPVRLNFTVEFHSRRLDHAPGTVEVRAMSVGSAFPLRMRRPILRFHTGKGTELDLTAPGRTFRFFSSCLECPSDTVIAQIRFDALQRFAKSDSVDVDALGFTVRLKPTDLQTLHKFIDAVSNGVRIQ